MRKIIFYLFILTNCLGFSQPNITFRLSVSPRLTYFEGSVFTTFNFYNYLSLPLKLAFKKLRIS